MPTGTRTAPPSWVEMQTSSKALALSWRRRNLFSAGLVYFWNFLSRSANIFLLFCTVSLKIFYFWYEAAPIFFGVSGIFRALFGRTTHFSEGPVFGIVEYPSCTHPEDVQDTRQQGGGPLEACLPQGVHTLWGYSFRVLLGNFFIFHLKKETVAGKDPAAKRKRNQDKLGYGTR